MSYGPRIAFTGKICSGKSTYANILVQKYGYTLLKFAAAVYQEAYRQGMVEKDRALLQRIGTEARKRDPNHWVTILIAKLDENPNPIVIDDCRFKNEMLMLKQHGFRIYHLFITPEEQEYRIRKIYSNPEYHLNNRNHYSECDLDDQNIDPIPTELGNEFIPDYTDM